MLTQNYINVIRSAVTGLHASSGGTPKGQLPFHPYGSNSTTYWIGKTVYAYNFIFETTSILTSPTSRGIVLGSGSTPPTVNDVALESLITSGITKTGGTLYNGVDEDDNPFVEVQLILKNTSANTITIREVGYVGTYGNGTVYTAKNGTSTINSAEFLADRTILDEPLVLAPDATGIIDYRITIDIS